VLCLLNFSRDTLSASIALPRGGTTGKGRNDLLLQEAFTGSSLSVSSGRPTEVVLPPRGYRIYVPAR